MRTPSVRNLVAHAHERQEVGVLPGGLDQGEGARVDVALGAVEGEPVALLQHGALHADLAAAGRVHVQVARADDAALAPAAGHERRVRGHAAAGREDALRRAHAFHVLGVGLFADQDDLLALPWPTPPRPWR